MLYVQHSAVYLVKVNASKIQYCCLSNRERTLIIMNRVLNRKDSIILVGVICSDFIWHGHIIDLALAAGEKIGLSSNEAGNIIRRSNTTGIRVLMSKRITTSTIRGDISLSHCRLRASKMSSFHPTFVLRMSRL